MGHCDYRTTLIYADYAPDGTQGRAFAERAFAGPCDAELAQTTVAPESNDLGR